MLKSLVLLFALIAVSQAQLGGLAGGWNNLAYATQEVQECSRWALKELNKLETGNGRFLDVLNMKNIQVQVVSGLNVRFTSDMLYSRADEKYVGKTCTFSIYYQSWTNTIKFNAPPACEDNTMFGTIPDF